MNSSISLVHAAQGCQPWLAVTLRYSPITRSLYLETPVVGPGVLHMQNVFAMEPCFSVSTHLRAGSLDTWSSPHSFIQKKNLFHLSSARTDAQGKSHVVNITHTHTAFSGSQVTESTDDVVVHLLPINFHSATTGYFIGQAAFSTCLPSFVYLTVVHIEIPKQSWLALAPVTRSRYAELQHSCCLVPLT